jgi:hypothetical protein
MTLSETGWLNVAIAMKKSLCRTQVPRRHSFHDKECHHSETSHLGSDRRANLVIRPVAGN